MNRVSMTVCRREARRLQVKALGVETQKLSFHASDTDSSNDPITHISESMSYIAHLQADAVVIAQFVAARPAVIWSES